MYRGNSNGTFTDVTTNVQLYDGFSRYYRVFDIADFNNDFYQDVLAEIDGGFNGNYKLYKNTNGVSFSDVASSYGINLNTSFSSGAHVWFDYNNDGAVDLFANVNGNLKVLKNNITGNNWLKMRLYGCASNADAYGVKVTVKANGKKIVLTPTRSGLLMPSDLHIGLGIATTIDSLSIYWHKSPSQHYTNLSPNQYLNIYENQNANCSASINLTMSFDMADSLKSCGDSAIIDAGIGYTTYTWSTGATAQSIYAKASGWYKVTVSNGVCTATDSVFVSLVKAKITASKTRICKG